MSLDPAVAAGHLAAKVSLWASSGSKADAFLAYYVRGKDISVATLECSDKQYKWLTDMVLFRMAVSERMPQHFWRYAMCGGDPQDPVYKFLEQTKMEAWKYQKSFCLLLMADEDESSVEALVLRGNPIHPDDATEESGNYAVRIEPWRHVQERSPEDVRQELTEAWTEISEAQAKRSVIV